MDINSILKVLGESGTSELSKAAGASDSQITDLVSAALPTLLGAMQNNAKDSESAAGLAKALDDHAADDISDVGSFLKNVDTKDGAKILSHVLGSNTSAVESSLAEKSGMDAGQVANVLTYIAPLLLTFLGQQKKSSSNSNDLVSLFGGLLGQSQGKSGLTDTLLGAVTGLFKK